MEFSVDWRYTTRFLHASHTYLYWGFRLRVYFCTNRILINPAEIGCGVTNWRRIL